MRIWLWLGTALDALLFLAALYFAWKVGVSAYGSEAPNIIGVAVLFAALPVLCAAAIVSAWRAWAKGRRGHALTVLASPFVYAGYLFVFLRPF